MGLISGILLLPILGPAKGLVFVLEQIKQRVDAEQLDESLVEDELVALSLRHDFGEVSDDDYFIRETELLERINAIRAYKESLAETGDTTEGDDGE